MLDLTAQLVSKSLVVGEERRGVERYRMLEPIRQFAIQQTSKSESEAALRLGNAEPATVVPAPTTPSDAGLGVTIRRAA